MNETGSAELRRLAERYAITTEYWDFGGRRCVVADETLRAVLAAMGVDARDDVAVGVAQAAATVAPWRSLLPPVVVMRHGVWTHVRVHAPAGSQPEVWIELEVGPAGHSGGRWETYAVDGERPTLTVDGSVIVRHTVALPAELPTGYHTLKARTGRRVAECQLIVAPATLPLPACLAERPGNGLQAQLYSIRSARSWGIGDYADLAELAYVAAARLHADFVLVNPLHAAEPCSPITPSPYLPASRLFSNVQAIRPEEIDEMAYADAATAALVRRQAASAARANTDAALLDRDKSWSHKLKALEAIYRLPRTAARQIALERFALAGGPELARFAEWCVLREHTPRPARGASVADVEPVPALGSAAARSVLETESARERIAFHIWLQWIADQQLEQAQRAARRGGMRLGIMHDLAVGVHPAGADVWALGDLLARGITAGAPADYFNPAGQDWSQPPWCPDQLARTGYRAYRTMLRRAFAHAGAVRIDHIIGLFRLWWIPAGFPAREGAYVRYDHEAMVGIALLEAERAGGIVIGEDLGLVEPWVRDYLAERGVLGTSVLWFEREEDGTFPRSPERYRRLSLATLTTHDLPPTAAQLAGEHVAERERLGLLPSGVQDAEDEAKRERELLVALLSSRGLLPTRGGQTAIVAALHRMLRDTPSVLRGISIADLAGERRAQNLPGVAHGYPNWCVPLADEAGNPVLLEDLFDAPLARELM